MGIRVHKFLGYGLIDLEPRDSRVNWDSWLLHYEPRENGEYETWLSERGKYTLDLGWLKHGGYGEKRRDLRNCIAWDREYGLTEVLAIQPFGCPDWSRYDDPIDYMEETYPWSDESQRSRIKTYQHGPFPFNGSYMDARDGRLLPPAVMPWWRLLSSKVVPGSEKMLHMLKALDLFAGEMGFAGNEEAKANVVPQVPEEIRDLAEFAALFTDDRVWLQLRPLLYTWWG